MKSVRNSGVSADRFRRVALGMDGVVEGAHMDHPDFRVNGRIFATLHHDLQTGMVKLTPEQQRVLVRAHPSAFEPETGAWGRQGCTAVHIAAIDDEVLGEAITLAWRNLAAAPSRRRSARKRR